MENYLNFLKNNLSATKPAKQALMDINGRISIDYDAYEEVNFAQDNLIRVKRKNKYGFVDRKLNIVIPCKYNSATDFNDGLSICTLKQESFVIDVKGESSLKTKGIISFITKNHLLIKEEEGAKIIAKKAELSITKLKTGS